MKFNPGQTRKVVNGVAYIKDIPKKQVDPPVIEPKVESIQEIKPEENELRRIQVEQTTLPSRSEHPRKPSTGDKQDSPRKSRI